MAKSKSQSTDDARLRELFEQSDRPILLLNRQMRLVYANAAWQTVSGCPTDVLTGKPFKTSRNTHTNWTTILGPSDDVRRGNTVRQVRLIPAELFPDEKALPQWWELTFVPLGAEQELAGVVIRIEPVSAAGVFEDPPLPENIVNLRETFAAQFTLDSLPDGSPEMRRVRQQICLAIQTSVPVMIHGEAGVGKRWLARVVHSQGPHPEGYFINIDCERLPSGAVAAVIFGRHGLLQRVRPCTLHLRNPDRLPHELQVRVADNETLWSEDSQLRVTASMDGAADEVIAAGRLSPDLYTLLSPLTITLPPLRERRDDIAFFVERMLPRANDAAEAMVTEISDAVSAVFHAYDWPGNLMEVYQVMVSACRRQKTGSLDESSLPFYLSDTRTATAREIRLDEILEKVERRLIELALRETSNKKQAAEMLSIWRPRLLRRIAALGLEK